VQEIEARIRALPMPTVMLQNGERPEHILARVFGDDWIRNDERDVRFHCPCTRERAERALILLGQEMLQELMEEARLTGRTELACEFCGDRFHFDADEMETLLADARADETGGG